MRKTAFVAFVLFSVAFASPAAGQPEEEPAGSFLTRPWDRDLVVSAVFGGAVGRSSLGETFGFTLYDEPASIATAQRYGGGFLVDVGAAYRLGRQGWRRNLLVGGTFTYTTSDSRSTLTGSIPSPIFTDRPRPLTGDSRSLGHSEAAFHLSLIRMFAVRRDLDVGVFAGPSVFRVSHEFVGAVGPENLQESGPPLFETVSLASMPRHRDNDAGFGGHAGASVTYRLPWSLKGVPELGVTTVVRYAAASVSLDGAGGRVGVNAGGLQLGAGVRLTFGGESR